LNDLDYLSNTEIKPNTRQLCKAKHDCHKDKLTVTSRWRAVTGLLSCQRTLACDVAIATLQHACICIAVGQC